MHCFGDMQIFQDRMSYCYLFEFLRKLIFYRIWIKIKNIALKLFLKNSQTIEQAPVLQK